MKLNQKTIKLVIIIFICSWFRDLMDNLEKTPLFRGLKPKKIKTLLENGKFFTRKYYKNNYIAYRGDEVEYLMLILKGKVQTLISDDSGKIRNLAVLDTFCAIAPSFLFGKNNRFPVDVKSLNESLIFFIGKSEVFSILKKDETVLKNYLDLVSDKAQLLATEFWKNFANNTIKKKITDYFKECLDSDTMVVKLDKTLEELAKYFDVSRPSLSRAINELIKSGAIERVKRGVYVVKDRDFLN